MIWENARKKLPGILFTVILLVVLTAGFSSAGSDDRNVVRVGYYENEVFEEGARQGAVKKGYAYEYYLKLSEYTGWEYEYVYGSYGELYQMLLDGKIDLLAGLAKKEERAGLLLYPDEAMGNESYSLVKHGSDTSINVNPSSIEGKKIGVLDSAIIGVLNNYLAAHFITAEVVSYADYETLFAAFDNKEVDLLAAEGDGAYGRDNAEVLFSFGASDYYLCVSIDRPDLLSELNMAQASLNADEPTYINYLKSKYYPVSVSSRNLSEAEKKWIAEHDSLTLGYLNNYMPYSGTGKDGKVTGIVKDLMPALLAGLGLEDIAVTYVGYDSYDDMITAMGRNDIDVAFPVGGGLYYSEENGIYQSGAVITSTMDLVFKGEYSENKVKSIAINQKNRMQYYYVKTNFPDSETVFFPSIEDCLNAVIDGKVSCTVLNGLRANNLLKNHKYNNLSQFAQPNIEERCFGVEIGEEGLLKLLNRGIKVIGSDYAANLIYKYTEGLYTYTFWDMVREHYVVFITIIILISLFLIFLVRRDAKRTKEKNAELAKSREALAEALDAAENANRAKTTFLSNMSHDIRTPMNAIVGFTEIASGSTDDPEMVKDYLDKISVSSQHMLALINDVLDMSRIESGNLKIEEAEVNLPGLIKDLEGIVYANVTAKHQELSVTINVTHEYIITDRLRLNQVLLNILSNAVKFTKDYGKISLSVTEADCDKPGYACYEFLVKDNGIGMSEEYQKTIFEAFSRERNSTVSGIQGTGLGMAITKNIVDMMGGRISVKSKEGVGSEFLVELSCRISEHTESAAELPELPDFTGRRLLMAEDNELNRHIALAILNRVGFEVEIANNGEEAVRMVEEKPAGTYDAILMDIQMPKMDGYEATRRIRALSDKAKSEIPIVAVTANAFEEDRQHAYEAGMDGHLAKPYKVPEMMEKLKEVIENGRK